MSIYINASLRCHKCGKWLTDEEVYFYDHEMYELLLS